MTQRTSSSQRNSSSQRTSSSQRADAVANRGALLDTARRLYAERGLEVPYEEIARAAGVGRATLYRHFPTRDHLLTGILDSLIDQLAGLAAGMPASAETFFALLEAAAALQEENLPLIELLGRSIEPSERVRSTRQRIDELFAAPLAAAQAAGRVRPELRAGDVRIVLMMLSSLARRTASAEDRARAQELARGLLTEP